jgi:hypothetical protein
MRLKTRRADGGAVRAYVGLAVRLKAPEPGVRKPADRESGGSNPHSPSGTFDAATWAALDRPEAAPDNPVARLPHASLKEG